MAAAISGWNAFPPPISQGITAVNRMPAYSSMTRIARVTVAGSVSRSSAGIGDPI